MDGATIAAIIAAIIFCLISSACNCAIYVERSIKELKKELLALLDKEKSQSEDCDPTDKV